MKRLIALAVLLTAASAATVSADEPGNLSVVSAPSAATVTAAEPSDHSVMSAPSADESIAGPVNCCAAQVTEPAGGTTEGLVGGAGFYVLQPRWNRNNAITIKGLNFNSATLSGAAFTSFNYDYDVTVAPRIWLGYVFDGGLGVRARYWHFEEAATANFVSPNSGAVLLNTSTPLGLGTVTTNGGDVLNGRQRFETDIVDLEATQPVDFSFCSVEYTGGLRFGRLCTTQGVRLAPVDPADSGLLSYRRDLEGVGPTVSYEFRRPCGPHFALYQSSRVAILFGDTHEDASLNSKTTSNGTIHLTATGRQESFVPMGEVEVGAEWSADLGGTHLVLQGAFAGMAYNDVAFPALNLSAGLSW